MSFEPRTSTSVLKTLAARVIQRSKLNDLVEGSVLTHILASVADEIVSYELRLSGLRDSFHFTNTLGMFLDVRAAEMPPAGLSRADATLASGEVLSITREDTDETGLNPYPSALTIPAGSMFESSSNGLMYRLVSSYDIPAGASSISNVYVISMSPGSSSNVGIGEIDAIVDAPEEVISVTNLMPLTNGTDKEEDGHLRMRIAKYLSSLARCQPTALEYACLTFESASGQRATWASCFEDVKRPGYSEIVIDDGSGLLNFVRDGEKTTGVVQDGGVWSMWFEKPAIKNIEQVKVIPSAGGEVKYLTEENKDYISIPERGTLFLTESGKAKVAPGDTWVIDTQKSGDPYQVYTELIADLQVYIEGSTTSPTGRPGLRAAGTRVRVVPPRVDKFSCDIWFVPVSGIAHSEVSLTIVADVVKYTQTLAPGVPLYASRLIDVLLNDSRILNIRLYKSGTYTPLEDFYPADYNYALRASPGDIKVVAAPEGD